MDGPQRAPGPQLSLPSAGWPRWAAVGSDALRLPTPPRQLPSCLLSRAGLSSSFLGRLVSLRSGCQPRRPVNVPICFVPLHFPRAHFTEATARHPEAVGTSELAPGVAGWLVSFVFSLPGRVGEHSGGCRRLQWPRCPRQRPAFVRCGASPRAPCRGLLTGARSCGVGSADVGSHVPTHRVRQSGLCSAGSCPSPEPCDPGLPLSPSCPGVR